MTGAVNALDALTRGCCDPVSRRRAQAYVESLTSDELADVFVAIPVLDGMVRHEITTRPKATT